MDNASNGRLFSIIIIAIPDTKNTTNGLTNILKDISFRAAYI